MNSEKVERYTCGNGEGMFDDKKGYWVTYGAYKDLLDKYETLVKESDSIDLVSNCDPDTKDLIQHTKRVLDLIKPESGIAVKVLSNRVNKKLKQLK